MKKLMAILAFGLAFGAFGAASTQYKVYDVKMSLKTTKAAGITSTACGDEYVYREKANRKIEGVIAGCGCIAMAGDPSCSSFRIYFWDATTKTQLTNFTFSTEIVQRIGKTGKVAEQLVTFSVEGQDGEMFELSLAGFGSYSASKKDSVYDTISVNGGVTGTVDAPYKTTAGSCGACEETPDSVDQTQAMAVCEDGACTQSDTSDVTPVYGTYTMKYNKSKSAKCEKLGASAETLGLPSYVKVLD